MSELFHICNKLSPNKLSAPVLIDLDQTISSQIRRCAPQGRGPEKPLGLIPANRVQTCEQLPEQLPQAAPVLALRRMLNKQATRPRQPVGRFPLNCIYIQISMNSAPTELSRLPASTTTIQLLDLRVPAGFPSPADDHMVQRCDLVERLSSHLQATYFLRVRGNSMVGAGTQDQDNVALVDNDFTSRRCSSVMVRCAWWPPTRPNRPTACLSQDSGSHGGVTSIPGWRRPALAPSTVTVPTGAAAALAAPLADHRG